MRLMKLPVMPLGQLPKSLTMLALAMLLAACGYHLRGEAKMPFKTLYIEAVNPDSVLIKELRSNLKANNVQLLDKSDKADIILNIAQEQLDKQILTLDSSGRVNGYQLRYRVSLRAYDNEQNEWLPANEVMLTRDFIYDNSQILAMTSEEEMLNQSMRSDMVQQIVRRLSHARALIPPKK
jgi:LPS-assembly lipoprotein